MPRADAVFVRREASAADAVGLISRHGHSNYPVLGDRPDDVAGVLGVRDLLGLPADRPAGTSAGAVARPPLLSPDTLPLPDAVEQMRPRGDEFAVVLDEHGGVAGIVTYEDIAEELVGDIAASARSTPATLVARARGRQVTAAGLAGPVPEPTERDTVGHAVEEPRRRRASLAVVRDETGRLTGLLTLDDLLARLLHPQAA